VKRTCIFLAIALAFLFANIDLAITDDTWMGKVKGEVWTDTSQNMKLGTFGGNHGAPNGMFMSGSQKGAAGFSLSGKERNPDQVKGSVKGGYSQGYFQQSASPLAGGGYGMQKSWAT
jgi:hypothetical protein